MLRSRLALIALFTTAAAACRMSTDYTVHDTEGREYRVACRGVACARELESPSPARTHEACAAGRHAAFVLAGQRLLVACPACVGAGEPVVDHARCRALRCETASECPPPGTGRTAQCVHGLCEAPALALDPDDVMSLCMAGAGASGHENARDAVDRAAIASAACRDRERCQAASVCRAP